MKTLVRPLASMLFLGLVATAQSQQPLQKAADAPELKSTIVLRKSEMMARKPDIDVPGVKVWNMRSHGTSRTNMVEFSGKSPLHYHPDAEHTLLVVEGSVRVKAAGEELQLDEGDYVSFPPNVPHGYWVDPGSKALLVSFDAPAYDPKKTVFLEGKK